jgi:hypothetical protein
VTTDPVPKKRSRVSLFGRDVAVNMIGNLATAAVLYLAAVAGGYVKANPALVTGTGFIVVLVAAHGLMLLAGTNERFRGPWLVKAIIWLGALAGVLLYSRIIARVLQAWPL